MKLKIEFINEDTDQRFVVKNIGDKVFFHDSYIHDPKEFEQLTGKAVKFSKDQSAVIAAFYNLGIQLMEQS